MQYIHSPPTSDEQHAHHGRGLIWSVCLWDSLVRPVGFVRGCDKHSSATRSPPAGAPLLSAVWKMCQVEGFCPSTVSQTRISPFPCLSENHNCDEIVAELSYFPTRLKCSTSGRKLFFQACILEHVSKNTTGHCTSLNMSNVFFFLKGQHFSPDNTMCFVFYKLVTEKNVISLCRL